MSVIDVIVGAVRGIAERLVRAKYERGRHFDFEVIKKVYESLHKKITECRDLILKYVGFSSSGLSAIREITKSYWFSRVPKNISAKIKEWQSLVSEYDATVKELRKKIEKAVGQEIDKRAKTFEPNPINEKIVKEFRDIMDAQGYMGSSTAYLLLIRGKIDDDEHDFIKVFIRGEQPERENRSKLASGFPKAIYEEVQMGPLCINLNDKAKEIDDATTRLLDDLGKQIKK